MLTENLKYSDIEKIKIIRFGYSEQSIVYNKTHQIQKIKLFEDNKLNSMKMIILIIVYNDNTIIGEIVDLRTQIYQLQKIITTHKSNKRIITKGITTEGLEVYKNNIIYANPVMIEANTTYNIGTHKNAGEYNFYFNGVRRNRIITDKNKENDYNSIENTLNYKQKIFKEAFSLSDIKLEELKEQYKEECKKDIYLDYIERHKNIFFLKSNEVCYKIIINDTEIRIEKDSKLERKEVEELRKLAEETERFKVYLLDWMKEGLNLETQQSIESKYNLLREQSYVIPEYIIYAYKTSNYTVINYEAKRYIEINDLYCEIDRSVFTNYVLNIEIISVMYKKDSSGVKKEVTDRALLPYYSGRKPRIDVYGDYIDVEITLLSNFTSSFNEMKKTIAKDKVNLIKLAIKLIKDRIESKPIKNMAPLNFYKPARYKLLKDYTLILTFELKIKSEDKEVDTLDISSKNNKNNKINKEESGQHARN